MALYAFSPDVGDGGRLRCLYGKVDTTISCVCTCSVGSTQCSECVVYGPGTMATICVLLLLVSNLCFQVNVVFLTLVLWVIYKTKKCQQSVKKSITGEKMGSNFAVVK